MPSKRKCPYEECCLPDNNNKYKWQFWYLVISAVYLIADQNAFNFFSLLMFTVPIVLDLTSTKINNRLYTIVSDIFVSINLIIVVFCICGMFGFFVDNGNSFSITKSSMVLPDFTFDKKLLLFPIAANLTVPVMMLIACPTKRSKRTTDELNAARKVGSA